MTQPQNRRKRVRVPTKSNIRHSEYQSVGTPVFQENSSMDISSNGISFETKRDYKKGNLVFLEADMGGEQLKLLVCVAWVKKGENGLSQVGAELIAVNPTDKKKMQSILDQMIVEIRERKKKPAKKTAAKKKTAKKKVSKKAPAKKAKKKTVRKKK